MDVIRPLRMVNRYVKAYRKAKMGRILSTVRRIERVFPPPGRLVVAMTFDDGPTASPPCRSASEWMAGMAAGPAEGAAAMAGVAASPGATRSVTESLLDIMKKHGARGTFDVIGTTASNYPDREGKTGSALWSGVKYDHYPAFGCDHLAGVVNQTGLARRMLDEGHELANHGYTHVDFGPSRIVYGSRGHFRDSDAAVDDLRQLHDFVKAQFGYEMRLARPPHYIDRARDGKDSFDIFLRLKYNYLAASFDGGGWKASSGDYRRDVEVMVGAVRAALGRDPAALNGQIIFQKDGYNMSKQSPIVDAMPAQLEILRSYGYQVVTVSELLDMAPFTDVSLDEPCFAATRALAKAGYAAGFRDNSFKPGKLLTGSELDGLLAGPWGRGGMVGVASSAAAGPARFAGSVVTARDLLGTLGAGDVPADSVLAMFPGIDPDRPVTRGVAAQVFASICGLS